MSINDNDVLKIHESLKKADEECSEENPVSISSKGDVATKTDAVSLKEALQQLVKYAKMLEEKGIDSDAIPQKMLEKHMEDDITIVEDDVPNKD